MDTLNCTTPGWMQPCVVQLSVSGPSTPCTCKKGVATIQCHTGPLDRPDCCPSNTGVWECVPYSYVIREPARASLVAAAPPAPDGFCAAFRPHHWSSTRAVGGATASSTYCGAVPPPGSRLMPASLLAFYYARYCMKPHKRIGLLRRRGTDHAVHTHGKSGSPIESDFWEAVHLIQTSRPSV